MDAAYWEDLAGRLYGLLILLEDRLGSDQAELFHEFIEVGEYGLTLEENRRRTRLGKIAITDQERGDMLAMADSMKMDDLVPHALGFCPKTANPAGTWRQFTDRTLNVRTQAVTGPCPNDLGPG